MYFIHFEITLNNSVLHKIKNYYALKIHLETVDIVN